MFSLKLSSATPAEPITLPILFHVFYKTSLFRQFLTGLSFLSRLVCISRSVIAGGSRSLMEAGHNSLLPSLSSSSSYPSLITISDTTFCEQGGRVDVVGKGGKWEDQLWRRGNYLDKRFWAGEQAGL